jgi:threonine dehydratase
VDDFVLVSEDEIKDAILLMLEKHSILVEGAAALSIAAFIKTRKRYENRNVILIISGKRISVDTLRYVLNNGSDRLINRE